jgi:ribonucleoside-diphosphate reductase alpha chain
LLAAFEIGFVFNQWSLGEECLNRLGFKSEQYSSPDFNLLRAIGFNRQQIAEANEYICGTMTVEGAPYLKEEHYPIFDCANKCGQKGERYIHAHGHIQNDGCCTTISFQVRSLKPSTCQMRQPLKKSKIAMNYHGNLL